MTNYSSVINTADNRLIRSEVRELALAFGLVFGFRREPEKAMARHPANPLRQKQYTELPVSLPGEESFFSAVPRMAMETLKQYFKHYMEENSVIFYDTKKFTHYRNRQSYGKDYMVRLDSRTMQYFWTTVPSGIIFPYAYDRERSCLDLGSFYCITHALDARQNLEAITDYLKNVCDISCDYGRDNAPVIMLKDRHKAESLYKSTEKNLRRKLIAGGYLKEAIHGQENI